MTTRLTLDQLNALNTSFLAERLWETSRERCDDGRDGRSAQLLIHMGAQVYWRVVELDDIGDEDLALIAATPNLLATAIASETEAAKLRTALSETQARAEALQASLQGVLDEVWDGRRVWTPDPSTCQAAYTVLTALKPAVAQKEE